MKDIMILSGAGQIGMSDQGAFITGTTIMPVIEMKANVPINDEQKKALASGFVKAFADAGEDVVSHNLLVTIRPGSITPERDCAPIAAGFLQC